MSENTRQQTLAEGVEGILREWAKAQSPEQGFEGHQVCFFVQPVQHREGIFFAPGELALCRPAEGELAEQARAAGLPRPMAVWSFDLEREVLVPQALMRLEKPARPAEVPAASAR